MSQTAAASSSKDILGEVNMVSLEPNTVGGSLKYDVPGFSDACKVA